MVKVFGLEKAGVKIKGKCAKNFFFVLVEEVQFGLLWNWRPD
jgi:hypothetical protein